MVDIIINSYNTLGKIFYKSILSNVYVKIYDILIYKICYLKIFILMNNFKTFNDDCVYNSMEYYTQMTAQVHCSNI